MVSSMVRDIFTCRADVALLLAADSDFLPTSLLEQIDQGKGSKSIFNTDACFLQQNRQSDCTAVARILFTIVLQKSLCGDALCGLKPVAIRRYRNQIFNCTLVCLCTSSLWLFCCYCRRFGG